MINLKKAIGAFDMRWVKHMTNCSQDPKIRQVRAEFGNDGYAAFWTIVETVAAEFTRKNPVTEITFPIKTWAKICEISPKKLQNFLKVCEKNNLLQHQIEKNYLTIKVPKLLNFGDEYSKKVGTDSGQTPDSVGTNSGQTPDPVRASSSTSPSPYPEGSNYLSTGYVGEGADLVDPSTGEVIAFGGVR